MSKHYLLSFYVPEENLEPVLEAIFSAGAGKYRNYDKCAWTTEGTGRFRPLGDSHPFIGNHHEETKVKELKVECYVAEENINSVKKALVKAHPYEEPAYNIIVTNII